MPGKRAPDEIVPVEKERASYQTLLAQNPNYFGNLPDSGLKAIKKIASNTKYEELTCVGFNPDLDTLEATIAVKLPGGYGGSLCLAGTTEWVRFFVDYGSGWQDAGVVGVNVHDIPNDNDCASKPEKPLTYVVTQKLDPKRRRCSKPVLPNVRAILSWQTVPPANPAWTPVWGGVLDRHIQVKPSLISLSDVFADLADTIGKAVAVPPALEEVKFKPIPQPDPPPFTVAQLAKLYTDAPTKGDKPAKPGEDKAARRLATTVEAHRFGHAELAQAMEGGEDQHALSAKSLQWKEIGLDWESSVVALAATSGNTGYEQLDCLGLEYKLERLVATFRIKKPAGYSGGPCTKGSYEYVAFWADWNDTCDWTYVGTAAINVHDFATIPAGGLHYSAVIPVDLAAVRQACTKPKVARIRAVLSWSTPPPPANPNFVPTYGNRVDTHVQIRPGQPGTTGNPASWIENVGGIALELIETASTGKTVPFAKFSADDAWADPWVHSRKCAFGGLVRIEGPYFSGFSYRIQVRKSGGGPQAVTNDFYVDRVGIGTTHQTASPADNGFFRYLDPTTHFERTLAHWATGSLDDGDWEFRLTLGDGATPPNPIASTPWYNIRLDNTPPQADIQISNGGDCKDFVVGSVIQGEFVARDQASDTFGAFTLSTHPNTVTIPSNAPTTATPSTSQTAPRIPATGHPWTGGDSWQLNTASPVAMKACGYVVRVDVADNTIVGSQSNGHHWASHETGFCLRDDH